MGHLYDTNAFASGPAFDRFLRNILSINKMALKIARPERRQKRVTYNNMPFAKPEKRGFLGDVSFCQFREVPTVDFRVSFDMDEHNEKKVRLRSCTCVGRVVRDGASCGRN